LKLFGNALEKCSDFAIVVYWLFQKNVPIRLLGTRFTNAISCFRPGPQEPYRDTAAMQEVWFNSGAGMGLEEV
jgi:hypothetical protein